MIGTVRVKFWGPLACFTRPEFKAERASYDMMTPSAARGAVESILWRPSVFWVVRRLEVLRPIKFIGFRRNEVTNRAAAEDLMTEASRGDPMRPFFADENRAQRSTLALRDVAYIVEAEPWIKAGADRNETPQKFLEMLSRRVSRGQCFQQPSFGCREFVADFGPDDGEHPTAETRDLGRMLHDIEYGSPNRAHFFNARLVDGVLEIPIPAWLRKTA
jgi:CRISPR-associated protein Cas5d